MVSQLDESDMKSGLAVLTNLHSTPQSSSLCFVHFMQILPTKHMNMNLKVRAYVTALSVYLSLLVLNELIDSEHLSDERAHVLRGTSGVRMVFVLCMSVIHSVVLDDVFAQVRPGVGCEKSNMPVVPCAWKGCRSGIDCKNAPKDLQLACIASHCDRAQLRASFRKHAKVMRGA